MPQSIFKWFAPLALFGTGCAMPMDEGEPTAAVTAEIMGGTAATEFYWSRAALFSGRCTGIKIAPHYILTASHCTLSQGDNIQLYTSGPTPEAEASGEVQQVFKRDGVHPSSEDFIDVNGKFADIAVIKHDAPTSGHHATLAWEFPGGEAWGTKVGAAEPVTFAWPNTQQDPPYKLRTISDQVYSGSDNAGHFLAENRNGDPGDSGGGFFDDLSLLGILFGQAFEWQWRDKYTSVPFHLKWILNKMEYTWAGQPVDEGRWRNGTIVDVIMYTNEKVCQYACSRTQECVAYSFMEPMCYLLSSVDENFAAPGASSARK